MIHRPRIRRLLERLGVMPVITFDEDRLWSYAEQTWMADQ